LRIFAVATGLPHTSLERMRGYRARTTI